MAEAKKKPGLALVVGVGKPKGDEPDGDEAEDSGSYSAAADELFDALKDGDREAFADALKAAVMACK